MSVIQIGDRLGDRYELVDELGQGGMSVVYRGIDSQLQRSVAVKVMHGFLAEQPEARERFRREAVAVANLNHPHIIEVFDYSGPDAQTIYMVAELVDGHSLADLLDEDAMPAEAALILTRPIADALRHAHEHGVVHRDVKPENVLVDERGTLKLTDFGIARILDNQTLTVTGTLLGSPAYMSPEYIDGQEPDARSDIFSLGAMLYLMTVGDLPFCGPSPHALLKRIAAGKFVPANQQNPKIHGRIARLIHRCLEKDPQDRYATAIEVVEEIDAILERLGLDWDAERVPLLADIHGYGAALCERLPQIYVDLGRAALDGKQTGAAVEDFDRVLSLQPHNREVRAILDGLVRRAWVGRSVRDGVLAVAGAILVTASVVLWIGTPAPVPAPLPVELEGPPVAREPNDTRRNVPVEVKGIGDLFVDGELYWDEFVDGHQIGGSHTLLFEPGQHELFIRGAGRSQRLRVDIAEEGRTNLVMLDISVPKPKGTGVPPPGKVSQKRRIEFNAKQWVNVYVDGAAEPAAEYKQGRFEIELGYGKHEMRFTNPYGKPRERVLLVNDTSPPEMIVVELEPKDARLLINGVPEGGAVTVEVAGKKATLGELNRDEPILVPLSQGRRHKVRILKKGYAPLEKIVTFTPGQTAKLEVQLQRL